MKVAATRQIWTSFQLDACIKLLRSIC